MFDRLLLFDPSADVAIVERRLPHWSQPGVVCFITLRTNDSMPAEVVARWRTDRSRWLRMHGIDPDSRSWHSRLAKLSPADQRELHRAFSDRWHEELDRCHGECLFRDPELAGIVADSLKHFDGERYLLTDFVVMPNHVQLLAAFPVESQMLDQCESWKHFTATQINRRLSRRGRFWQQDGFDHLLRSEEQFRWLQRYIADNPVKARLHVGEYVHYHSPVHAPRSK